MEYPIDKSTDGKSVLEVTKTLGISRALLKHLKFLENGITVNGKRVTVRYRLKEGERLSLAVEDFAPQENLLPVSLDLPLVYEDGDVAVPNKPADMPTHPSHNHRGDTVANALAFRYAKADVPFIFRPVNRLDRNTSGLLIIAKNRIAAAKLADAMKSGKIRKTYLAILVGELSCEEGLIRTYMRRTAESIIVRENCAEGEGGDLALTRFRVLLRKNGHTLVCASPITGRTHQLRVHFAGLGCPILGDDLYGEASPLIGRHALHSARLSFPRVSDGRIETVLAPLPEDMHRAAEQLFGACEVAESLNRLSTYAEALLSPTEG